MVINQFGIGKTRLRRDVPRRGSRRRFPRLPRGATRAARAAPSDSVPGLVPIAETLERRPVCEEAQVIAVGRWIPLRKR